MGRPNGEGLHHPPSEGQGNRIVRVTPAGTDGGALPDHDALISSKSEMTFALPGAQAAGRAGAPPAPAVPGVPPVGGCRCRQCRGPRYRRCLAYRAAAAGPTVPPLPDQPCHRRCRERPSAAAEGAASIPFPVPFAPVPGRCHLDHPRFRLRNSPGRRCRRGLRPSERWIGKSMNAASGAPVGSVDSEKRAGGGSGASEAAARSPCKETSRRRRMGKTSSRRD